MAHSAPQSILDDVAMVSTVTETGTVALLVLLSIFEVGFSVPIEIFCCLHVQLLNLLLLF